MTTRLLVGVSSVSQHRPARRDVYDPRRMDLDLTHEQELIRDTVRSFARERVAPVAEELDRESRFPVELVREMAALGLMGIPIPERYGGSGGDTVREMTFRLGINVLMYALCLDYKEDQVHIPFILKRRQ